MKIPQPLLVLASLAGLTVLAASGTSRSAASDGPTLDELAWMAGHWASEVDGERTEEVWLGPGGRIMLGMNRSLHENGHADFEYLRIEQRKDSIVYVASPGGRTPTDFTLVDCGKDFALFANPEHDFPKEIRYELTPEGLHARVSGAVGGKEQAEEWTWKKR